MNEKKGKEEPVIIKAFFPLALFLWVVLTLMAWIVPGLDLRKAPPPNQVQDVFLDRLDGHLDRRDYSDLAWPGPPVRGLRTGWRRPGVRELPVIPD